MTDRDRLMKAISNAVNEFEKWRLECLMNESQDYRPVAEFIADHLLANGVIILPCQKGAVLNRNGEKCIANHWNIILTAFNENNQVRLFDVKEAEQKLKERDG